MAEYFLRKWFEEQLRFRLPDGTEEESVFIGNTALSPPDILKGFGSKRYDLEFNSWLNDEWKPRQDELRQEILTEVLHFALSAIRSRLSQDSLDL